MVVTVESFLSLRHNSHRKGLQSCVPLPVSSVFFRSLHSSLSFDVIGRVFSSNKRTKEDRAVLVDTWRFTKSNAKRTKIASIFPRNIKHLPRSSSLFLLVRSLPSHHHHHRCLRSCKQLNNNDYDNSCTGPFLSRFAPSCLWTSLPRDIHVSEIPPVTFSFVSSLASSIFVPSLSVSSSCSIIYNHVSLVRFCFRLSDSLFFVLVDGAFSFFMLGCNVRRE